MVLPLGLAMRIFKKAVVLTLLLGMSFNLYGVEGTRLEPVSEPWHFGRVQKGDEAQKTFVLRNSGTGNAVIENVSACCGYGVVDVSRWDIPPGENSEITVTCDTSRKAIGEDTNKVTVKYNSDSSSILKVEVRSDIVP